MAIVIFCGDEDRHSKLEHLLEMLKENTVEVYETNYRDVRTQVQKTIRKVNILNNNYLKSERYELYLIAKRYGVPYCVINFPIEDIEGASSENRYDNPYVEGDCLNEKWLAKILGSKIRQSIAHAKMVFDSNYISEVKNVVERVNKKHGSLFFFKEAERKMIKLLRSSPVSLDEVERSYEKLVLEEFANRT